MKWSNLKNMECPKCKSTIVKRGGFYECNRCDFVIGLVKFDELVGSMYRKKNIAVADNAEALNNLGHDKVSEDFLDSPYLDY